MFVFLTILGLSLSNNDLPQSRAAPDLRDVAGYTCANTSCKQISSCEEACYKLLICGHKKRDGDNDGIPCENLCSAPCER